ncbi:MAG: peptidylprolyl isomerase [Chloroflexota bacterium]
MAHKRSLLWTGLGLLVIALAGCKSGQELPTLPSAVPTNTPLPPAPTPTPTFSEPLAALVNGEPIFLDDYLVQVMQAEQAIVSQGQDPDTTAGQDALAQARQRVLEAMIEQVIILQAAAREGVIVSDETVEAAVQQSITDAGGQAAFEAWLQANSLTADDYRRSLHAQLVAQAMFQRVTQDVPQTAEQVHARHIALATEEQAQQVLLRLQNGEDFATLASQFSQDTTTRDNGGDLGFFPRGLLLSPEIEEVAFSLAPQQISGVVRTQFGQYHIVQVLEKEDNRQLPEDVLHRLRENTFEGWLAEQMAVSDIRRLTDES